MKRVIAAVLAACLLPVLVGCGKSERAQGQLIVGRLSEPVSLDPAQTVSSGDFAIIHLAYQRLTRIDPASGQAVGDLAHKWTPASNGMSWTFELKKNARFSDGSEVDAQSVKFSFDRLRKVSKLAGQTLFWLKDVSVVDSHTVRFDLTMPFPPLDRILAVPVASIVSPALVAKHEVNGDGAAAWMTENSAGSGPYVIVGWDRGSSVTLRPPAGREVGSFNEIVFRIVANPASLRTQIEKGDVDVIEQLGAAESQQYQALTGVTVGEVPSGMGLSYLTFNTSRPPFDNLALRQAVVKAIDYDALIKNVLANKVSPLASPVPPGLLGHDASIAFPVRDIAAARALVESATGGKGVQAKLMVYAPGPTSQLIQANLKEAGIEITLEKAAPAAFDAQRASGEFDLIYDGWQLDFPDPFIIMNFAFPSRFVEQGPNFSRYRNADVDRYLDQAMVEMDPSLRDELYRKAVSQVMADLPMAMLFSANVLYAYRADRVKIAANPFQPYEKTLLPATP